MRGVGPSNNIKLPVDREIQNAAKHRFFMFMLLFFLGALWTGTECLAFIFHFSKSLAGEKIIGPIYNPWALAWPWGKFIFIDWPATFIQTAQFALIASWSLFAAVMIAGVFISRRAYQSYIDDAPRAHDYDGSSHWAQPLEIGKIGVDKGETMLTPEHWAVKAAAKTYNKSMKRKGLKAKVITVDEWKKSPGIFLGEYIDPKTKKRYFLRDTSNRHVGLYAPTRSGKGVGIVIPAALSWSKSMVVNDPKGELFEVTSWYRKNVLKQNIFKFDPLSTDGSSVRINVLDFVRIRTEHEISDAQNIAKMLCDPQGLGLDTGSDSDHWRKTAYAFLTGVILHILYASDIPPERKNLTGIDEFLSDPNCGIVKRCTDMIKFEHDPELKRGWSTIDGKLTKTNPTVAMAAKDMVDRPEGERGSVLSSVKSYFDLYRNPIVAKNIATSDFSFEDLMYNEKAATLYLINYPKDMEILRPLMRLVVNSIMTTFTGQIEFESGKPIKKYKNELLMLMDEFTSTLAKMSIFANALAFVAGYGIKVVIIVQDLVQLAECYQDKGAQALTSNLHIQIMFATNNSDTAQQISTMLGNQTIRQETRSWGHDGKKSRSESYRGRPLLNAAEVQALPPTDQIIMVTGEPAIHCNKITYYSEPAFQVRFEGKKPVKSSDRLARSEQAFYATLAGYEKEGEGEAAKRIAIAEIAAAMVGPSHVLKAVNKAFEDLENIKEDDERPDDSGGEHMDFLRGIM